MNWCTEEDWKYFLTLFSEYGSPGEKEISFRYELSSPSLRALDEYSEICRIIRDIDTPLKQVIAILQWTHAHLIGDGMCTPPEKFNALSVLQQTKEHGMKSNCWMYATVMTELCLAAGFYARMVRCMPLDLDFNDCHCLTTVYLDEYQRWIVFDPANKAYYLNRSMSPMDLPMLRRAVIASEQIYVPMAGRDVAGRLMKYFTKNLLRFECAAVSRANNEYDADDITFYQLNPKLYRLQDKQYFDGRRNIRTISVYNEDDFWKSPYDR